MRRCLNIGCGNKPWASSPEDLWINVDIQALPGVDVVCDCRKPLPFGSGEFDHVRADNFLEHLAYPDNIHCINQIDRVLKVGGICTIIVPRFPSPGSVQDPGHVSFYTERSALYWNTYPMPKGTPYSKLAGFTSQLVATQIIKYGDSHEEEYLRFELVKRPPPPVA